MHVVDSIIHNSGGDVLAGVAESPCLLDVQVQSNLASRLAGVLLQNGVAFQLLLH